MSKTKIENLPSLEDLDPEDQRLIGGNSAPKRRKRERHQSHPAQTAPLSTPPEDDIIISRIPPDA